MYKKGIEIEYLNALLNKTEWLNKLVFSYLMKHLIFNSRPSRQGGEGQTFQQNLSLVEPSAIRGKTRKEYWGLHLKGQQDQSFILERKYVCHKNILWH